MAPFGGFEHNIQSLRVVDELEQRYAEFPGLNLTFETREGILKHCSQENARQLGDVGQRFLTGGQPSLEAQIANLADAIAYNNHDVDDGLRAGFITIEQLRSVDLFEVQYQQVAARYPDLGGRRLVHEIIRRIINEQAVDLIATSAASIAAAAPRDIDEVRAQPKPLVHFSAQMQERHQALKRFLRRELYQHYRVQRMTFKAQRVMRDLFQTFFDNPRLLAPDYQERIETQEAAHGPAGRARVVADYVAGMTDRYAISVHRKLFDPLELT
jgi:dGTPase